ncbi:MAG: hypothetical protein MI923_25275 [Phycisphaerales bacterium]|nr:hypothetical protein [Phycisphaerales bacterium]
MRKVASKPSSSVHTTRAPGSVRMISADPDPGEDALAELSTNAVTAKPLFALA